MEQTQNIIRIIRSLPIKEDIIEKLVVDIEVKGIQDDTVQQQISSLLDDIARFVVVIDETETIRQRIASDFEQKIAMHQQQFEQSVSAMERDLKAELESQDQDAARNAIDAA